MSSSVIISALAGLQCYTASTLGMGSGGGGDPSSWVGGVGSGDALEA